MKTQTAKKYILLALCVLLILLILFRNVFIEKGEHKDEYQEEPSNETILKKEAYRLFGFLAEVEEESTSEAMTCGEFRDALFFTCKSLDLDYDKIISDMPERLYDVTEDDVLIYLEEFLYVYDKLILAAQKENPDIYEKHVYILDCLEPEEKGVLITSEGERLKLNASTDYSDIFDYLPYIDGEEDYRSGRKTYEERLMTAGDCIDKSFRLLCMKDEIIYFVEETHEEFMLHNAWIINGSGNEINVFAEGIEKTFACKKLSETITDSVADIVLHEGTIIGITIKQGTINGKVLMADDKYIELEGFGKLQIDPYLRIYKIYDELEMEKTNTVLVGYSNTDFIVIDGKICAALITQKITADNIRVLIKTDNFKSNFHETVTFTSDRSFTVRQDDEEIIYPAGKEVTVKKSDLEKGRITIIPETENAKLKLLSVKRSQGNPAYRGTIEIADSDEGLIVINDLSMEEYLYAVVPSEMPVSYGLEALKVQAVCARSYAYNQLMANQYRAYGAHVDDSVNYQVYNNIPETEESILAVKETYGTVMDYEGEVITAYYFSTSFGHTANVEDVWENGTETVYLTGGLQMDGKPSIDLSDEESFQAFLYEKPISIDDSGSKESLTTYDSGYNYYRWNVTLSADEITKRVDDIIYSRYQVNKASVLTMVTEKEAVKLSEGNASAIQKNVNGKVFMCKPVKSIGTVKNIKVISRGTSGIIKELLIEGEKETILVAYQTNIRMILAPVNGEVTLANGTTTGGMSLLPSAYCSIEKTKKDKKDAFLITGGGYGHGVGMSQNGARTMSMQGKNHVEILTHYYPGVKLAIIYQ